MQSWAPSVSVSEALLGRSEPSQDPAQGEGFAELHRDGSGSAHEGVAFDVGEVFSIRREEKQAERFASRHDGDDEGGSDAERGEQISPSRPLSVEGMTKPPLSIACRRTAACESHESWVAEPTFALRMSSPFAP